MKTNAHAIVIRTKDASLLLSEIIRWGEAAWWPKKSHMRFERLSAGPVVLGTRYRQKVLLPFAPSWQAEVSELTDKSISRKFLDGMFMGCETIGFTRQNDGLRVDYAMRYQVRGCVNRLLWPVVFERLHNGNIEAILKNLKEFMETRCG